MQNNSDPEHSRNKLNQPSSPQLRPDLHSHISQLLNKDYSKSPTTQFVDNILTTAYPALTMTDQEQPGPIEPSSFIYQQPYSISPNNKYQSIVITQLTEEIRTKDDIDIQIIKPNELHLIATSKSMPHSSIDPKPRSKSTGHIALRFSNESSPSITTCNSIECQTDSHIDPFAYTRNGCIPTLAETENLSFSYAIDENERLIRLDHMINDTYDEYLDSMYISDPCVEFEHYLRGNGTGNTNNQRVMNSAEIKNPYESIGTQTFFTSPTTPINESQYTQTTPRLERKAVSKKPVETQTSTDTSALSSPEHLVKTKSTISIPKEGLDKIKDKFHIKIKDKPGKELHYAHSTEYINDLIPTSDVRVNDKPQINVHESLVLSLGDVVAPKPAVDKIKMKSRSGSNNRSNLSQSAIEVTTVLGNTTTVTGISGSIDSPDRFTMSIDYPSNLKKSSSSESVSSADTIKDDLVPSGNKVPNYPPPRPPTVQDKVLDIISPLTNGQNNQKKEQEVPKVSPDSDPVSPDYSENIYDINNAKKNRKPAVIECNDPEIEQALSFQPITVNPEPETLTRFNFPEKVEPKISQQSEMPSKVNQNPLLPRGPPRPLPPRAPLKINPNQQSPASTLMNKPPNRDVKQSFIKTYDSPSPDTLTPPKSLDLKKVLPTPNKNSSFKSRLNANGFQTQDIPLIPQRTVTPISRVSISSSTYLNDYGENMDIDLNVYKEKIKNASKISFNDTTSDIIDIDFEAYNEEQVTPTEKIESSESDDESNSDSKERLYRSSRLSSKSDLLVVDSTSADIQDVDFDVYEEKPKKAEPYIITELIDDTPEVKNFRSLNLNRPSVTSTSPSPSSRIEIPAKIHQSGKFPTLGNLISSMNIDSGKTNELEDHIEPRKGPVQIKKLFNDWNNLIEDDLNSAPQIAASVGANTVTFGAVNPNNTNTKNIRTNPNVNNNSKQNVIRPSNNYISQAKLEQQQQPNIQQRNFQNQPLNKTTGMPKQKTMPPKMLNNPQNMHQLQLNQFKQKQQQLEAQSVQKPSPNPTVRTPINTHQDNQADGAESQQQQQQNKSYRQDQFSNQSIRTTPAAKNEPAVSQVQPSTFKQNKFNSKLTSKLTSEETKSSDESYQHPVKSRYQSTPYEQPSSHEQKYTNQKGQSTSGTIQEANTDWNNEKKHQQQIRERILTNHKQVDKQNIPNVNEHSNQSEQINNNSNNNNNNFHMNMILKNSNLSEYNNSDNISSKMRNQSQYSISKLSTGDGTGANIYNKGSIKTILSGVSSTSYLKLPDRISKPSLSSQLLGPVTNHYTKSNSVGHSRESLDGKSSLTCVTNDAEQQAQHLCKIIKLMNVTAQKEFEKMLRRIDRRKVRVPEILEQLKTSKPKQTRRLEDELRLLMRKSERDNLMLQRAMSTVAHQPKSLNNVKKLARNQYEITKNLESSSQTSFSTVHSNANVIDVEEEAMPVVAQSKRNFAKESGYSSFEDSLTDFAKFKFNSIEHLDVEANNETTKIDSIEQRALYQSPSSALNNFSFETISSYTPIKIREQERSSSKDNFNNGRGNLILTQESKKGRSAMNNSSNQQARGQQPSNSSTSNSMNNSSNQQNRSNARNQRNNDEDDLNRQPNRNQNEIKVPDGFRIEYISEDELGENYQENYQVDRDPQTGEFYILDFENRIKFIIVMDKVGHNLGNYSDSANRSNLSNNNIDQNQASRNGINNNDQKNNTIDELNSNRKRGNGSNNNGTFNSQQNDVNDQYNYNQNGSRRNSNNRSYNDSYNDQNNAIDELNSNQRRGNGLNNSVSYNDQRNNATGELNDNQRRGNGSNNNDSYNDQQNIISDQITPETMISDEFTASPLEYVQQSDLKEVNLDDAELYESESGEQIIYNRSDPSQQWVVLADDWRESQDNNFLAIEDIDLNDLNIFIDPVTGRRFVSDEESGISYFLVTASNLSDEFKRRWTYLSQTNNNDNTELNDYSDINNLSDSDNEINIDYIDEDQVNNISLEDGQIVEDEATGEAILFHPSRPNTRWVVLSSDWQTSENSPYVDEADTDLMNWDVYTDEETGRQYVIDESSDSKFYIVNSEKIKQSNFSDTWNKILTKSRANKKPSVSFNTNTKFNDLDDLNDDYIKNLDHEPSNLRYRTSAKHSPDRVITPNSRANSKNLLNTLNAIRIPDEETKRIMKQPGKMDHLTDIKTDPETGSPKKSPTKEKDPRKRSKSERKELKKTLQQQQILKNQQEAARRAFLNRKMPGMGPLWLHQQLLDGMRKKENLHHRIKSLAGHRNRVDDDYDHDGKHWKSLSHLNDPTLGENDSLDRQKLAELQMYGYSKFDPKFAKKYKDELKGKEFNFDDYWKYNSTKENSPSDLGFGGGDQTFVRGVLTENFKRHNDYVAVQMNSKYKALVPQQRLELKQQFLLTPRYLEDSWMKKLNKSNKIKPRIIIINDDERIITAKKNCNVYVQYIHENDGVIGTNPMYQFMLPNCGPTKPSRPLLITPKHLKAMSRKMPPPPKEMALREAPVFVYHQNGNQFFENIAQYLAGRQAKLSPKTVRKILKFQDMKEFEEYLSVKLTREEALKISELSGNNLINVNEMLHQQQSTDTMLNGERAPEPTDKYYHFGCEYDPLRMEENLSSNSLDFTVDGNQTHQIEINNQIVKSTFIGYNPAGESEQLTFEDLPDDVVRALQQAPQTEKKFLGVGYASPAARQKLIPKL